jgi:hypothetical protein
VRRRQRPTLEWPIPLQRFIEADWQAWLLDGPDPAASAYADGDSERFYQLHADRPPAWHVIHRRLDAHKRWTAARRSWLEAHGHPDLALDCWLDDVSYEHRVLRRELREASRVFRT